MAAMKRPPLLIVLLVLATVLTNVTVWTFLGTRSFREDIEFMFGIALPLSQINLLSIWLCFGRSSFALRLVVTGGAIAAWSTLLSMLGLNHPWAVPLLASCVTIVGTLLPLQWLGVRVIDDRNAQHAVRPWEFQFSITQMLTLTTAVAICLGILKASDLGEVSLQRIFEGIAIGLILAPISLPAFWLAMSKGLLLARLLVFVFCPILAALALGIFFGDVDEIELYVLAEFIAFLCLASLFVVRLSGYRLVRFKRTELTDSRKNAASTERPTSSEASDDDVRGAVPPTY
ncbi:MAG: hypothetical protein DWQ35_18850 [Planctomycetota bacterium]|nr:MAG: hypothetical protein DWQ35_18850 [Planctomycetota bacterium]REK17488.1 MAG: hypothetical protein DWQ42_22420 [Planctomycetota bacterium]REK42426.1 MAG: hypothetical protein DWQ46_13095 [Planctomycetota bacterium]